MSFDRFPSHVSFQSELSETDGRFTQLFGNLLVFVLPSPFKRDLVVAGVGLHPTLIIVGALVENFLAHDWGAENLADKVNHLLPQPESPFR